MVCCCRERFLSQLPVAKEHFGGVERDVVQLAVFQRALMAKEMVCSVVDIGEVFDT